MKKPLSQKTRQILAWLNNARLNWLLTRRRDYKPKYVEQNFIHLHFGLSRIQRREMAAEITRLETLAKRYVAGTKHRKAIDERIEKLKKDYVGTLANEPYVNPARKQRAARYNYKKQEKAERRQNRRSMEFLIEQAGRFQTQLTEAIEAQGARAFITDLLSEA